MTTPPKQPSSSQEDTNSDEENDFDKRFAIALIYDSLVMYELCCRHGGNPFYHSKDKDEIDNIKQTIGQLNLVALYFCTVERHVYLRTHNVIWWGIISSDVYHIIRIYLIEFEIE